MELRISGTQLFWMIATMQVSMTILLTIKPAIMTAKQDSWISILGATLIGMFIAFVCTRINREYPGQTLVTYLPKIVGNWLGRFIIFIYGAFWYIVLAMVLRQYSDFIVSTILPRTPIMIPVFAMLLAAVYVTRIGIEGIARCSQILGPFLLIIITLTLLLSIRDIQLKRVLPFYVDSGWNVILQGALPTATFQGDCILLLILLAFISNPDQGTKPAVFGVALVGLLTCAATFVIVTVFGDNMAAAQTYPYFNLVRYISIYNFFQNLDAFLIPIWIIGVFMKVSLYFFVCTYGTAQVFKVTKWQRMLWVVVPIILLLSMVPRNYYDSSLFFPQKIAVPFLFPIHMLGVPLLLWIISWLKNKKKRTTHP
ncbi:GerAB/ArcD/ProY family transporter [Paenibacillus roseipurpureus]|uniref:Endospore germination permease n=1 Tax=Paenibacillus roseopurpureus TaxID=2918901 RepID=A0AA96LVF9_9BACL|nr:endospore germination permease [Paenibacillus sp. MBLB1832]WNR46794.1 endospore germination permease [Paenibacillus sp. MBLB1832]